MKLFTLISLLSICFPVLLSSQSKAPAGKTSTYVHCTKFYISKPMRELPDYKPATGNVMRDAADDKGIGIHRTENGTFHPSNNYTDPLRQTATGSVMGTDMPLVDFEGAAEIEFCPGDPNGAVGPNDYVQLLNTTYTVFDKLGNTLLPTKDLGSFWPGDPDDGDPVVLYDKFADRWFISEFQVTNIPNQLCVGVSTTNDPTGSYYVWIFSMGNTDPDYPKYSIWSDGYYLTFQGFNVDSGQANVPQQVGVLERNRMLRGDPGAGLILGNIPTPPVFLSSGPYATGVSEPKTLDCDASALPPFGTPNYLVYFRNTATGAYSNIIAMDSLIFDTTAHTLTITRADSFAVPYFNSYFTGGTRQDISQPGYAHGVSALDGRFSYRTPYIVFTGYNSVVLSNAVNLGGLVAGIRWYELRQDDGTGKWSVYQEGTYGPNDGISRWNAAIGEDEDGDIALTYNVADSVSVYPGIRYTGRLSTDPLGQMTFAEQTAVAGTATIICDHRWGDYSQMDVDPSDGLTFWGINQYGGAGGVQDNRIFSFKLEGNSSTGIKETEDQTEVKAYQDGNYLEVIAKGLPGDEQLLVNLFDISGRQLTSQNIVPVSSMFETKINVSSLPKGIYFVRIGRMNFQRVVKTVIH